MGVNMYLSVKIDRESLADGITGSMSVKEMVDFVILMDQYLGEWDFVEQLHKYCEQELKKKEEMEQGVQND
jgi:hypothetical protein